MKGQFKRRQEILEFIKAVVLASNNVGIGVNEDKLISKVCLRFFCGERLVKEMLKHMYNEDIVRLELGEVWLPKILEQLKTASKEDSAHDKILQEEK